MVFNNTFFLAGIIAGLILWLVLLSALLVRTISHYNRVTRGVAKAGLQDILESIVTRLRRIENRTVQNEKEIAGLVMDAQYHFQRIALVRFNPFADTGGAQSFVIALLDGKNNGIVMTSLYARTGNRWYVKEVIEGRGKELDLSKEERAAIAQAKPFRKKDV